MSNKHTKYIAKVQPPLHPALVSADKKLANKLARPMEEVKFIGFRAGLDGVPYTEGKGKYGLFPQPALAGCYHMLFSLPKIADPNVASECAILASKYIYQLLQLPAINGKTPSAIIRNAPENAGHILGEIEQTVSINGVSPAQFGMDPLMLASSQIKKYPGLAKHKKIDVLIIPITPATLEGFKKKSVSALNLNDIIKNTLPLQLTDSVGHSK